MDSSKQISVEEIGNKYGLMMHDPIHRYHVGKAMEEYARPAIDTLKRICDLAKQFEYLPNDNLKEIIEKTIQRYQSYM